ncbi:hypothetical protein Cgig2_009330 [Carnegiea gigantea]|uniref:Carbohydrate kinase PfkB domain-containing protein n=1 Tax=Carnegiea gigantea TaxID=171969 RepID=A0A9Q1JWE9_9CARY|nr:hypothetical protein Cgig2_009330 [Carnegiea gigantea]
MVLRSLSSHSLLPILSPSSSSSSSTSSRLNVFLSMPCSTRRPSRIVVCSHQPLAPLPDDRVVVGCGGVSMDYLVMVDGFPKPDEKVRGVSYKVQGGGNVGNALTCAARLGLKPRIIAKVAGDSEGRGILEELEGDGVDTSYVVVSDEGRSMFTYLIVDNKMKTRTAIYQPGHPPLMPAEISKANLSSALEGAKLVYFDGLSLKTALVVAEEASRRNIPILVDAEMGEEGFDNLLNMASYAVCSAKYPQAWTNAPSMPSALVSMLVTLPNLKFVIVTLGEEGCIMLQRVQNDEVASLEAMNVDQCFASLNQKRDCSVTYASCVSSPVLKLEAHGIGTINGKLLVGTAETIPPSELVDTTGAGDAFIGAVLYDMPPVIMLPFAAQVLGCGGVSVDYLAVVASFPKPDDKIRSTSFQVQGGGNAGNALTCAARLGLNPRLISKIADDVHGKGMLKELEADGVDTSFLIVSPEGNSPFSYVIVDNETKTRTCIHTPGSPSVTPEELPQARLESALDGVKLVYSDVRLPGIAINIAKEATCRSIPIVIDAERKREGLDELLSIATYVVCPANFPQVWTEASSLPKALLSMLLRLPNVKFVIVTLGENGCILLERKVPESEELNIEEIMETLKQKIVHDSTQPSCVSSSVMNLTAGGLGTLCGRLHVGTAEKIPPSELVDTTGAGDAFVGAILYDMPPERMLAFAAKVVSTPMKRHLTFSNVQASRQRSQTVNLYAHSALFYYGRQLVGVERWELDLVCHIALILVLHLI